MTPLEKLKPGRPITLADGNPYIIPPLTFRQLRDQETVIAGLSSAANDAATFDKITNLVLLALKRNYDDVTADELSDLLTLENMNDALSAAIGTPARPPGKVIDLATGQPVEEGKVAATAGRA